MPCPNGGTVKSPTEVYSRPGLGGAGYHSPIRGNHPSTTPKSKAKVSLHASAVETLDCACVRHADGWAGQVFFTQNLSPNKVTTIRMNFLSRKPLNQIQAAVMQQFGVSQREIYKNVWTLPNSLTVAVGGLLGAYTLELANPILGQQDMANGKKAIENIPAPKF